MTDAMKSAAVSAYSDYPVIRNASYYERWSPSQSSFVNRNCIVFVLEDRKFEPFTLIKSDRITNGKADSNENEPITMTFKKMNNIVFWQSETCWIKTDNSGSDHRINFRIDSEYRPSKEVYFDLPGYMKDPSGRKSRTFYFKFDVEGYIYLIQRDSEGVRDLYDSLTYRLFGTSGFYYT